MTTPWHPVGFGSALQLVTRLRLGSAIRPIACLFLLQKLLQLASSVEHTICCSPAGSTAWFSVVSFQSALFAKVVTALCNNWVLVRFPADDADKRYIGRSHVTLLAPGHPSIMRLDNATSSLFSLRSFFPFSVQLPTLQIVTAIMQIFTIIAEAAVASLLVLEEGSFSTGE